ncbi:MAG: nuclear transport factor 2 family protein [Rhodospirillales bacterium]|nr:nuclear transport factor 2 family protein [Rhodospirillales bacterium]MDE0388773.1 nuclear transport factor 2 family protein [Rhodospirillales bacterium]
MNDSERRNLAVITEVCDAYNRHDVEGIVRHFAEDSSWLLSRGVPPEGGRARGIDEIRAMAHKRFRTIPDMYWHIRSHWVGGNRGCSEWTVTGTESNGNKINWLGCDIWELNDDGKVVTKDTYWKFAGEEPPE